MITGQVVSKVLIALALVALSAQVSSAATCHANSENCVDDETSLLQVQSELSRGTPGADLEKALLQTQSNPAKQTCCCVYSFVTKKYTSCDMTKQIVTPHWTKDCHKGHTPSPPAACGVGGGGGGGAPAKGGGGGAPAKAGGGGGGGPKPPKCKGGMATKKKKDGSLFQKDATPTPPVYTPADGCTPKGSQLRDGFKFDEVPRVEGGDNEEFDAVAAFFEIQKQSNLGLGRDVKDWPYCYDELEVVRAWRIYDDAQQSLYEGQLEFIKEAVERAGRELVGVGISGVGTELDAKADTLLKIRKDSDLSNDKDKRIFGKLEPTINEKLLLHGDPADALLSIAASNFNEHYAAFGGLFGPNFYMAESAEKTDQYGVSDVKYGDNELHKFLYKNKECMPPGSADGKKNNKALFYTWIVKTILGFAEFTCQQEATPPGKPPIGSHDWKQEKNGKIQKESAFSNIAVPSGKAGSAYEMLAKQWGNKNRRELPFVPKLEPKFLYNSLIAESGGRCQLQRHREFIVTHADQVMPLYLVAYRRK